MPELTLGSIAEFPPGLMHQCVVDGEQVVIGNAGGEYFALQGMCPHRGAMLVQGSLQGTTLVCPWHAWEFDVLTGKGISNPMSCLRRYNAEVRDNELVVRW